ncbi:MAG: flgI [Phycisphaerales bacterium]|nr:flgI [Phycisphaerales bacterium]
MFVSGFGLVCQLRGTGDSTASNVVRQYMIKELARHGFGDTRVPGFERVNPTDVLKSPAYAIVRVDAYIPPGARKDDWTDAQVSCLPKNLTTSLGHGVLFETDLKLGGADADNPFGAVNVLVRTKGAVAVNPAYALDNPNSTTPQAKASLRTGTVMLGARVMQDRPLLVQLRFPQRSLSRKIEEVVRERFQDDTVARAQDEGVVELYVPPSFRGDWQRFAEVARHLFVQNSPAFNAAKARQLAAEAVKPGARLEDISYCWEGLGASSIPHVLPLMAHADPKVAFFAARAAAFIGEPTGAAQQRLMQMARTAGHPYRLTAVRTLGRLESTAALNHLLRELVDADEATVRIEAYQVLARNRDSAVVSTAVAPASDPSSQKFTLDRVATNAPPLVYVTRTGDPRIALLGRTPDLNLAVPFTAMDNRLTLAAQAGGRQVMLFFRAPWWVRDANSPASKDHQEPAPVKVLSQPDVDTIIARLGGMGAVDAQSLDFSYGEVVAILQALTTNRKLTARDAKGQMMIARFQMQEPTRIREDLATATVVDASGAASGAAPQFGPVGPTPEPVRTDFGGPRQPPASPAPIVAADRPPQPTPAPLVTSAPVPANGSTAPRF